MDTLIEAKLEALRAQKVQLDAAFVSLTADMNAVGGAIQVCEQLLAELRSGTKPETKP